MPRSPSEHCDEIELVYVLGTHGWSDLYLIVSGTVHCFRITHVFSDPIKDLIGLCSSLIDRGDCWVRLYDEPGATLVQITPNRQQQHLVELLVFTSDSWEETPETADLRIRVTVKATLLIDQIVYQLYKTQALCSEESYARDRSDFPRNEFRDLIVKWKVSGRRKNPTKTA